MCSFNPRPIVVGKNAQVFKTFNNGETSNASGRQAGPYWHREYLLGAESSLDPLGNTHAGDGAAFKGRGFVQRTGRNNYQRVGAQIGKDLINHPELCNDPATAGRILAQFLKNSDSAIRTALQNNDLAKARKLVNGGSHGLDVFEDAYNKGMSSLPT